MSPASTFVCYAPSPAAHLTDLQSAVLRAIRDARGFYKVRGVRNADILLQVRRSSRDLAGINARQVRYACAALEALGLVSRNLERTANPSGSVREVVRWRRGGRRHA